MKSDLDTTVTARTHFAGARVAVALAPRRVRPLRRRSRTVRHTERAALVVDAATLKATEQLEETVVVHHLIPLQNMTRLDRGEHKAASDEQQSLRSRYEMRSQIFLPEQNSRPDQYRI